MSVHLISSTYEGQACVEEVITFVCTTLGETLMWALNDTSIIMYDHNGADDACGALTKTSYEGLSISSMLVWHAQDDADGVFNCTSIMTLSCSVATTVEVGCSTTGKAGFKNDSHQLRILGTACLGLVWWLGEVYIQYSY